MRYDNAHDARNTLHPSDYPTVEKAAEDLGVSAETIRRWIRDGRLIAYRVGPRRLRVDLESLDGMVQGTPATVGVLK